MANNDFDSQYHMSGKKEGRQEPCSAFRAKSGKVREKGAWVRLPHIEQG